MVSKRKRSAARPPSPTSMSMATIPRMLFLAACGCGVYESSSSSSCLVLAFSPPTPHRHGALSRSPTSPVVHHGVPSTTRDTHSKRSHLWALPRRSSSDDTSTQTQTNEPFFAQGLNDGQSEESDSSANRSSGGMDAYAQQMQEFAAQEIVTEPPSEQVIQDDRVQPPPPPPPPPPPRQSQPIFTTSPPVSEEASPASASYEASDNQPISSVDARVLESILSEGKLNLSSEEEVKKLLEGPRLQEGDDGRPKDDGDGKYSSKFVSAVSDDTFWNSLKAKASEIVESVGIYIENRIERDAATLAAIGIFTFDRISRDIGRALPAAGRATRKLLLSTNSSYAEQFLDVTDQTPFALPAERSITDREIVGEWSDLYEELTTPADEIRQVTEAIRDILSGKEVASDDYATSRRGVRSFAPAGTSKLAERQKRAYKARKKTVLKREREGIDRKVSRAIGSVTDATWEFRREMETDKGREAGYRSKGVRKALAAGATRLLEAGRESSERLLSGERRQNRIGGDAAGGVEIVEDGSGPAMNFVDVSPMEEEEIIEDVIEEANMEYAPDGLLSPESFIEEKRRLIASLESCLSQPSETWLTQEVVAQATESGISLDGTVLREVITNMVTLRDGMQKEMEGQVDLKIENVATELRRMKQMVDMLCDVAISAAGESAALLLKQELEGFVLSDSLDDIIDIELERMEQLLAEKVAAREDEIRVRKERQRERQQQRLRQQQAQQQAQRQAVETEQYASATSAATVVETEVIDSTPFGRAKSAAQNFNSQFTDDGVYTEVEVLSSSDTIRGATTTGSPYDNAFGPEGTDPYYNQPSSNVELVSDTEYSEYEQQFKQAQRVDDVSEEVEAGEQEDNPASEFVLRVVDVIFFIGEKFFLVLLPDLITGGARVTSRYARAQNRGRGTVGWTPLQNAKTKNIR